MRDQERFWDRVYRGEGACQIWLGYVDRAGYGVIRFNGKNHLAHRASWIIEHGPIPDGAMVLHRCDNPSCVNPAHLFLGTQRNNMEDMVTKGRSHKPIGTRNASAVLTDDQVRDIRASYVPQYGSCVALARRYGVGRSTIWGIVKGNSWKHVGATP